MKLIRVKMNSSSKSSSRKFLAKQKTTEDA